MSSATPKLGCTCCKWAFPCLTNYLVLIPTFSLRIIGAWRLCPPSVKGDANMIRRVLRITISASVGGCTLSSDWMMNLTNFGVLSASRCCVSRTASVLDRELGNSVRGRSSHISLSTTNIGASNKNDLDGGETMRSPQSVSLITKCGREVLNTTEFKGPLNEMRKNLTSLKLRGVRRTLQWHQIFRLFSQ
jgi:hypothetical protein